MSKVVFVADFFFVHRSHMCAGIDSNMTENVTVSVNRRRKGTNKEELQKFTKEVTKLLYIIC